MSGIPKIVALVLIPVIVGSAAVGIYYAENQSSATSTLTSPSSSLSASFTAKSQSNSATSSTTSTSHLSSSVSASTSQLLTPETLLPNAKKTVDFDHIPYHFTIGNFTIQLVTTEQAIRHPREQRQLTLVSSGRST